MDKRRAERIARIQQVMATLDKAKEENVEIDFKKFLLKIMSEFYVTRRIAREYIDVAQYKNEAKTR